MTRNSTLARKNSPHDRSGGEFLISKFAIRLRGNRLADGGLAAAFGLGALFFLGQGGVVFAAAADVAAAGVPLGGAHVEPGAEVGDVAGAGAPDRRQVAVRQLPVDLAQGRVRLVRL